MSTNPIVNIYTNPFDEKERETILLENRTSILEFLCQKYPAGFERATRVYLNNKQIESDSFNIQLKHNDILDIKIWPEEPTTIAIVAATIAGSVAAVVVMNNNKPTIPTIDQPENLSNLKKPGGNAYNLREQSNLARLNEPIPSQYGKVKWFPDLAAAPYVKFENRIPVVRYLLCLGHGQHQIDDILIGPTSIKDSSDVTATLYNPGDTMTEFNDNVYTIPEQKNINFKSTARNYIQNTFVNFHKANRHITLPNSDSKLTNVFQSGDQVRVYSHSVGDFNGVWDITDVTDQRLTIADTDSWTSSNATITVQLYKEGTYVTNPYQTEDQTHPDVQKKLGYLPEGSNTGIFTFRNPYLKNITLEIDFEAPQGKFAITAGRKVDSIYINNVVYLFGLDSDGNRINNHYKLYRQSQSMVNTIGNTYQISDIDLQTWVDPSTLAENIVFPTISDTTVLFTEDGILISQSDISSIDYSTGSVTFNTSKTGSIGVYRFIVYYYSYADIQFYDTTENGVPPSSTTPVRHTTKSNLFEGYGIGGVSDVVWEVNLHSQYEMLIGNAGGNEANSTGTSSSLYGGQGFDELYDNMAINRIKLIYPDVQEYPNVSLLALTINNTPAQQYTESNNVAVISTRKLIQYDGSSWSEPTATRSISWAIADMFMSTYGASKPQSEIDLAKLIELESTFSSRGDTFDGVFDSFVDIWEAVNKVARAGRTKCILDNNKVRFVRDEAQTQIKAAFTTHNILPNSFSINHTFSNVDSVRGVKVKFNDEGDQYTPTEVYSSENKGKYQEIDFFGVVNYNQAWRESQYLEKQLLTSGIEISFKTGLYGHIPFYGDLISIQNDLPDWGQSGVVTNKDGTTITTSEPLDFTGDAPFKMQFVKPNGAISGPHTVTQGANNKEAILDVDVTDFTFITTLNNQNPTIYEFGPSNNYEKLAVVTGIKANKDNETLSLSVVPYNAAIHTADTGTPPTKTSVTPNLLPIPPFVGGLVLSNVPESGSVVANWNPLSNINNYKVQKSTDNITYTDVSTPTVPTETISATGVLYVRVASVIDSTIGRYNVAVIKAT